MIVKFEAKIQTLLKIQNLTVIVFCYTTITFVICALIVGTLIVSFYQMEK